MKAEELICPNCHESVRDVGVVKVETGPRFHAFYYHPDARCFMFDALTERGKSAATWWQCRACRSALPGELTEYIDQHAGW